MIQKGLRRENLLWQFSSRGVKLIVNLNGIRKIIDIFLQKFQTNRIVGIHMAIYSGISLKQCNFLRIIWKLSQYL